jgi:hypothetical protein
MGNVVFSKDFEKFLGSENFFFEDPERQCPF